MSVLDEDVRADGTCAGFALYDVILQLLQQPYCQVSTSCDFLVIDRSPASRCA